jgi:hypothetical protein
VPVCGGLVAVVGGVHSVDLGLKALAEACFARFIGLASFGKHIPQLCRLVTAFCTPVSLVSRVSL